MEKEQTTARPAQAAEASETGAVQPPPTESPGRDSAGSAAPKAGVAPPPHLGDEPEPQPPASLVELLYDQINRVLIGNNPTGYFSRSSPAHSSDPEIMPTTTNPDRKSPCPSKQTKQP